MLGIIQKFLAAWDFYIVSENDKTLAARTTCYSCVKCGGLKGVFFKFWAFFFCILFSKSNLHNAWQRVLLSSRLLKEKVSKVEILFKYNVLCSFFIGC